MPVNHFTATMVYGRLGSAVRIASGAKVFVEDVTTGLTAPALTQNSNPVQFLTADTNGTVEFTADIGSVNLKTPAGALLIHSAEALASGASSAAAAAVSAAAASALAADKVTKGTLTMLASDHNVVGDGIADDGPALLTLLSTAATFGLGVTLAPNSVVRSTVDITPPSGTRLDLNGSTILSARPGTSDRLMSIAGKSNVLIYNGVLDGAKASYAPATEQRHNIRIVNSSNVTLRNVRSINAKGDGIYVGDDIVGLTSDLVLDRVTCDGNHRQGMSVVAVNGLYAFACQFINTSGTAPQAGMDVEPNTDTAIVRGIRMIGCRFDGNATNGLLVSTRANPSVPQDGGSYTACSFDFNGTDGVHLNCARNTTFATGTVNDNAATGVFISTSTGSTVDDIAFTGVHVKRNGTQGVRANTPFNRMAFTACTILDNGQTTAAIGLDLLPISASVGVKVVGCTLGNRAGTTQTHGMRTNSFVSYLHAVANTYPANLTAAVTLGDDASTRVRMDGSGFDLSSAASFTGKATWTSASGTTLLGVRATGNTVDQFAARTDGVLTWSSGSAAQDTQLSRVAANVLGVGADDCIRTGKNATASRPAASTAGQGSQFYDTTLSKPIWSDGTVWRDAAGTAV